MCRKGTNYNAAEEIFSPYVINSSADIVTDLHHFQRQGRPKCRCPFSLYSETSERISGNTSKEHTELKQRSAAQTSALKVHGLLHSASKPISLRNKSFDGRFRGQVNLEVWG